MRGSSTCEPMARAASTRCRAEPLHGVDAWLAPFRSFWEQRLDALGTEIKRGQSARRRRTPSQRSAAR